MNSAKSHHFLYTPIAAALAVFLAAFANTAIAAPDSDLWDRWLPHDPASAITVDHYEWSHMLEMYLRQGTDGVNRFDYGAVTPHDRATFLGYLDSLSQVPISQCRREEQLAFWINLYNALTVNTVLDHYPVESIRDIDISPGLFSKGPWKRKLFTVEGEAVSLDDIEHRILRPVWNDPRMHYVLNCAAVGCPQLNQEAFTADNAEALMNASARAYVNSPHGVSVDARGLTLSSIYRWYKEDFGDSDQALLAHIAQYADAPLAKVLADNPRIRGYHYDWRLNDLAIDVSWVPAKPVATLAAAPERFRSMHGAAGRTVKIDHSETQRVGTGRISD